MENIVEIRDLSFSYPRSSKRSLDSFSLEVRRGESVGLLGPNGAGKTTLISFLSGLRPRSDDRVTVFGRPLHLLGEELLKIGYAPQELALYPSLSVHDNLIFFSRLACISKERQRAQVERVLEVVDLTSDREKRVAALSGGMKRRLNLAIALLNEPELLILDEPTVGVDMMSRDLIFERINDLRRSGTTLIYTTHYLEEVERVCDSVAMMNLGQLIYRGRVDLSILVQNFKSFANSLSLESDPDPQGQEI